MDIYCVSCYLAYGYGFLKYMGIFKWEYFFKFDLTKKINKVLNLLLEYDQILMLYTYELLDFSFTLLKVSC